jgi:hypothetical protein
LCHDREVSYDLAVWEGDRPADDEAAAEAYESLCEQFLESDEPLEPTARIRDYMSALVERYPFTAEDSPWAGSPIGDAAGPIAYLNLDLGRCAEVSAWAAEAATQHHLVCYDPQTESLRAG